MNPWSALISGGFGWSLYGTRMKQQDGSELCIVVASTKVATFNLEQTFSHASFHDPELFSIATGRRMKMNQEILGDCRVATGATFQEAIVAIFADWDPDDDTVTDAELVTETAGPVALGRGTPIP